MTLTLQPLGDRALLVDISAAQPHAALRLALQLDRLQPPGLLDRVPARTTLTVIFDPAQTTLAALSAAVHAAQQLAVQLPPPRRHHIPVRYDGADLAAVAKSTGLTPAEVVTLHSQAQHSVALIGFLPGFAYLDGLPEPLQLPRRASPRTAVPAGAVAIANAQTGIYPQVSPGGWHIIGSTTVQLFDPQQPTPALLQPGDIVVFAPVERC